MQSTPTTLRIMRLVIDTTVDGPGWRNSIYCAGCRHACAGCHNHETWSFESGHDETIDELIRQLSQTEGNITFSGGDPMYQAAAFTELARRIRTELHRTIWCYTGFTFEEVLADPEMSALLPYLEVLVDGRFEYNLRDTNLLFRGSSNQRLVDVHRSLSAGKVVLFDYQPYPVF
jgi:anaerobic ribonucleoside-triphosphate reductase activating protein